MPELQPLRADHADAVLDFETRNRAYFAASIPDRGDDYFTQFHQRHTALLRHQDAGTDRFHLIIDTDSTVIGRVNLVDITDTTASVGYRVAEAATGRGIATWAVRRICALAADRYGLTALTAVTTLDNAASRTVLSRADFVAGERIDLNGSPGIRYDRQL